MPQSPIYLCCESERKKKGGKARSSLLNGCCALDSQTGLSKSYAPALVVFFWAQKEKLPREFEKKYLWVGFCKCLTPTPQP